MSKKLVYGLISCFMICCCSDKEKATNIVDFSGIYIFSQSRSQDTLFIESDSTYRHKFWSTTGDEYEATGSWRYNPQFEEILFKKFVFFNDSGPASPAGNWFSKVRFSTGNIDLMYSKENNIFYRKCDPSEEKNEPK